MRRLLMGVSLLALTACDLAPDLVLPKTDAPAAFKEGGKTAETAPDAVAPASDGKWKRADDKAHIEEFAWWRMFNDETLNALEELAMKDNPSLDVAAERVTHARAVAEEEGASLLPDVTLGAGPVSQRASPGSVKPESFAYRKAYTTYNVRGTINYEIDLFGKNRNTAKAADLRADAEANNYRASRLSLQADLAQTYFQAVSLRRETLLLTQAVETRKKFLELTQKKHAVGAADDVALSSAQTDWATAQSDQSAVAQQYAAAEHALAILVGQPPASFTLAHAELKNRPPVVPAGLPADLLERRPDVQAAIQTIAAANASIGVARAGYFPDISLSATGGFTSGDLGQLFNWSNRTWTIGPLAGTMVTQPLFEGGALSARLAESKSDYASAVASYRGSVLQAFREVEDNLSGLQHLSEQGAATDIALKSAQRTFDVISARYKVGAASYLERLDAERSLLSAQRSQVEVLGNRYITTVQLLKALGGSWEKPAAPAMSAAPEAAPLAVAAPAKDEKPAAENSWWDSISESLLGSPKAEKAAPEPAAKPGDNTPVPTGSLPPAELPEGK